MFADISGNDCVAVDGRASISNDRAEIRELFTPFFKAFWGGPDDPAIRIIEVIPHHARYWTSPNMIVASFAMLAGAVTGKTPPIGQSGNVDLTRSGG